MVNQAPFPILFDLFGVIQNQRESVKDFLNRYGVTGHPGYCGKAGVLIEDR